MVTLADGFKVPPGWDANRHPGVAAASASNYRLRKLVTEITCVPGYPYPLSELVRFYEFNREAVAELRQRFGLCVGQDFVKVDLED